MINQFAVLCHPQQIASTKTNLLLYDKRTCLGRNKLNSGVVIWVWCLHVWPTLHGPAEVRVSNYYASVLRIVQRDTKANSMCVQLTSPWREWVFLGNLCAANEAFQKNLEGLSGNRVERSVCLLFEDGLMHFILGDLEKEHLSGPRQVTILHLFFWRLCWFVESGWAETASRGRDGEIHLPGCLLPWCLPPQMMKTCPMNRPAMSTAGKGSVLETKHCLSALALAVGCSFWVWFPRHWAEMASLKGAKAD